MGEAQGGCWKRLRAAPPAYPLDKVKRSQQRPRSRGSIGPWPDRGSSLLRALMAASGCEWPRNIEQLRACPGPRGEWEGDAAPRTAFDIHSLRHWQKQCTLAGQPGSRKLDGPLQLCLAAAASHSVRMPPPRYGRDSDYFPSGVTTAGVSLSICWSVATILSSYRADRQTTLATPNYRVTGIYFRRWAQRWVCWQVAPQPRSPHEHVDVMSRHD